MAQRKKRDTAKKQAQPQKVEVRLTPEDILEQSPGYHTILKFFKGVLVGCLVCITVAFLLRINIPDLEAVAFFLSMMTYLFMGTAVFVWLLRLRPLRKQAKILAEEHNAKLPVDALAAKEPLASELAAAPAARQKPRGPQTPTYLKYRRVWRFFLFATGVMLILSYFSLSMVPEGNPLPLILLAAAYLPVFGALIIYRKYLRPLKQAWEKQNGN